MSIGDGQPENPEAVGHAVSAVAELMERWFEHVGFSQYDCDEGIRFDVLRLDF
jgi:hypothetical protein